LDFGILLKKWGLENEIDLIHVKLEGGR